MALAINFNPLSRFFNKHKGFILKHKDKFLWFHSFYALILGIGVMWLGTRDFNFIRLAIYEITFIWLSNLAVPALLVHGGIPLKWKNRIRLAINYFNRNFYQQILFFVLPLYYMSTTLGSANMIFIILVAVSAVLSTMDIVYDRYLSVKGIILSLFFAFNLFVSINVMLPILWGVRNVHAIRISALFAFLGFATFCFKLTRVSAGKKWVTIAAAGLMIFLLSEIGRPFIPPAPLRLDKVEFGKEIDLKSLTFKTLFTSLPAGTNKIYLVTTINAPLLLEERVRHSYYIDGRKIYSSRYFHIAGRGHKGFRVWTFYTLKDVNPGSVLKITVETEGDQLIGWAYLKG